MTQEALRMALEELANRFSEGWHEGIKIDASDIMLLSEAAEALSQRTEQEPVAYLVLFEGAGQLLEFKKGNYIHGAKVKHIPLYTKTQIEIGCSECGIGGGHALYCVACAEKFVGGYKESVPVHASELLTQVSTDTPPQRTWVGLTDEEVRKICVNEWGGYEQCRAIEAKLKEKNT
jgi:hypothetical protein